MKITNVVSHILIAAGKWQTGRFEFIDLMDRGKADVAQPDVGRVGGLTEARRVCQLAEDRGRIIVPHCGKTGIGIAASVHMAVNTSNCAFVEFLPGELCHSIMRKGNWFPLNCEWRTASYMCLTSRASVSN